MASRENGLKHIHLFAIPGVFLSTAAHKQATAFSFSVCRPEEECHFSIKILTRLYNDCWPEKNSTATVQQYNAQYAVYYNAVLPSGFIVGAQNNLIIVQLYCLELQGLVYSLFSQLKEY